MSAPPSHGGPGRDDFPSLPAKAPFLWNYLGTHYEMEFVGGLIGVAQDAATLALRPEIGWAIVDTQRIAEIKAKEVAARLAGVEADKAQVAERDKAQVVAPRIDPLKPRFEQFFQFVCPFCGHSEEIGLWYTAKTCANCKRMSRITRKP
jgi:hypothetical protein